jgi:hypothetical protein
MAQHNYADLRIYTDTIRAERRAFKVAAERAETATVTSREQVDCGLSELSDKT